MRKALWSTATLVLLLSGATLLWGSGAQAVTSTVTMGSDSEPNAFKFFPDNISIPVGSTIRWQNKSDIPHDATARNGAFKSEQLSKGGTFEFTFSTPGDFEYFCSVSGHEEAGMKALVKVTGGATTPSTAATTTTTAPPAGTTAPPAGGGSTTTTAKGAAGGSTTTTTAGAAGVTSTTQAPSVTPTSAPETGGVTTTTAPTQAEEGSVEEHASGGAKKEDNKKNSPVGIAFVTVSTALLAGISGKLLGSKP